MKKRQILALVLCAMLLTGIFTGCGNAEQKQTTTGSQAQTTGKSSEETTQAVQPDPLLLKVYVQATLTDGIKDEEVVKSISEAIWKEKGKSLTVEFVSDTFENENNAINLRLAANDLDMFVTFGNGWSYLEDGMTEDITDVLAQYGQNLKKLIPETQWNMVTRNGRIKGVASPILTRIGIVPWIRKDLLDQAGLAVPTNPQELENAILTLRAKDNTLIGIASSVPQWAFLCTSGHGLPPNPLDENGFIKPYVGSNYGKFHFEDPYTITHLENMKSWYDKGVLNKEIFTMTPEMFNDLINQGKVIVAAGDIRDAKFNGGDYADKDKITPAKERGDHWVVMDQLTAPNGGNAIWGYHPGSFSYLTWITKGIAKEKVEAAVTLLDWLAEKPENMITAKYGIEGETFTYNENKKIISNKDDGGNPVYVNKISKILGVYEETAGLGRNFVTDEYMKMYSEDIKFYTWPDGLVTYKWSSDLAAIRTDCLTIANEFFVKAVTGALPADKAFEQAVAAMKKAGVDKVTEVLLKTFKEVYPNGNKDYSNK